MPGRVIALSCHKRPPRSDEADPGGLLSFLRKNNFVDGKIKSHLHPTVDNGETSNGVILSSSLQVPHIHEFLVTPSGAGHITHKVLAKKEKNGPLVTPAEIA